MSTVRGKTQESIAGGIAPMDVNGLEIPINILIVDDEQRNLTVLETVLDDPGYRLVRADTVDKALLALIAEEFALIILDISMPGMSGFELAQMIRERKKTANVPIIFLTAYYNEDEHVLEGYAAGAVDYLRKPVNRTILRSKVETFAQLHRSTRALQQEVIERRLAQDQLRAINETLEQRVIDKTEALRAAKRAAEEANAAKSDFLAHMSHEIRTPMNAIFGFTQLLSESISTPVERDWISSIKKSGELLLSVINDVLDLSKIEAGKLDLHPQPTDLVDILDDMIGMFAPQAKTKGITLDKDVDTESVTLLLDAYRLRQILMNLISNSVKFTESGGVVVGLDIAQGRAAHLRDIVLEVSDTGVGIPAAHIDRIFEPFCQAHSSDATRRLGTGLGLTIARRLVDAMSGEIDVRSAPEVGTTFTIRIPDVSIADTTPSLSPANEDVDFDQLPPLGILIVDDVPWNLDIASGYLRNSHHCIYLAADGREGVEIARRSRPDVILMDLRMPVMNGYEALEAIRSDPSLAHTAVIAITASSLRRETADSSEDFDGFVRKPYSPLQLFRVLAKVVGVAGNALQDESGGSVPGIWGDEFRVRWKELREVELPAMKTRMRTRELGEFAKNLDAFASDVRFPLLKREAEALRKSIESFNVKEAREVMRRISAMNADFGNA